MPDDGDQDEDAEEPAVELGEGATVEGAPLARVASRLTWPIERSDVDRRESGTVIRTPDGPQELSAVLDEVEITYFASRQEFVEAVREAIGVGPIPTE